MADIVGAEPLIKLSKDGLVGSLRAQGLRFSDMTLASEGDYAVEDSDWNYKDIPHLHHVHALAEAMPAVIGRDIICTVNLQNILGIWFPMALVNFEAAPNRQVYYSTLFFFVLVVETHSESIGYLRTRASTTYSIGHPPSLGFLVPVMKWLIRRNYKVLMSEDLPMRDRRGALRALGYGFRREGDTYSFVKTLNILEDNVIAPPDANRTFGCDYTEVLKDKDQAFIGDIGLLGARLVRDGDDVVIYRRSCPHEGAGLDSADCSGGFVTCRWHGRKLKPIGRFARGQDIEFATANYDVSVAGAALTIRYLGGTAP